MKIQFQVFVLLQLEQIPEFTFPYSFKDSLNKYSKWDLF